MYMLVFSCTKLIHYLSVECIIVCKYDIIKYMLSLPILNGRIGKWILSLLKFDLRYELAKAIKEQVMADFITHHCGADILVVEPAPWMLFFDGSSYGKGCGIGIFSSRLGGAHFDFSLLISDTLTNNQAEYKAVLKGVKLLRKNQS